MMMSSGILLLLFLLVCQLCPAASRKRPHILHITVSDLGWADVDWRADDFRMPNLHQLWYDGVELSNYYAPSNGVASRIALATGKYPYTMGYKTFGETYSRNTNFSLSLDYELLSEYLNKEGYSTHLVGVWNLGFCSKDHTPLWRGYDHFYGSLGAHNGHYSHESIRWGGYDFRRDNDVEWTAQGKYSTTLFKTYITTLLDNYHNRHRQEPLFIHLAHDAIHRPLEAPDHYMNMWCQHIEDQVRRSRCAMMAAIDNGVEDIMAAFQRNGEDKNLLVFFSATNSGPSDTGSNNSPLKGFLHTLYEGGSRVNAFMYGSKTWLPISPYTYKGLMHVTDVLPTLMAAAKADATDIPTDIDGVSLWNSIKNNDPSPRDTIVYDVDVEAGLGAIRHGKWKLIINSTSCSGNCRDWELYDLESDPYENRDLSSWNPDKVKEMKAKYEAAKSKAVPHQTYVVKSKSDPDKYGGVWTPFGC